MPSRPAFALLASLSLAATLAAQTTVQAALRTSPADLSPTINSLIAEPAVSRAHWGVMVTSLDGAPIYALNEGQFFQPASNAKLFTIAAALALLKADARFKTQVIATQAPAAGDLKGDLILRGDGDANLSGRAIPYAEPPAKQFPLPPLHVLDEIANTIAATGLKHIDGNIVGDDTLFPWEPYPIDWAADDLLWGYGAPVSALSISDNQIGLTVVPGKIPPIPANVARGNYGNPGPATITLDPATPFYTIQNEIDSVQGKTGPGIGIERQPGSRTIRLYSGPTVTPETFEIAIDDPAEYAAASLKMLLEARGITITGKAAARHNPPSNTTAFLEQSRVPIVALGTGSDTGSGTGSDTGVAPCLRCGNLTGIPGYPEGVLLASHTSPTVAEDIVITDKESQNLHAEILLHQLAVAYGSDGSTAQGARVIRQFLINAGIDPGDFVFYDGSGLSGHDLVTPRAVAKLLQFASTQPWFSTYKSSLPVGGIDGSLESRFTKPPLKGHVFAKTGTLGEARALSGYLECASGKTVIFSILSGNHAPGNHADREVIDRIVAAIAAAD